MQKKYNVYRLFVAVAFLTAILFFFWPQETLQYTNNITIKEKDAMDRWLDRLVEYECPGCGPNFKIIDSNGKWSHGCLQFQEATWNEKTRRYGISGDIFDCDTQKMVARKMFEEEGAKAGRHWYTTIYIKKLGLPPGVDRLKKDAE